MRVKLARGVKGVNKIVKDFSQVFSQRLRELRGTQSKSAFGRFIGIPNPSTYHNYERGRVPDSQTVSDIAQRCGVTVDWLLGRDDTPHPASIAEPPVSPPPASSACRYPVDCDLPGQIAELREDYAAMQTTLAKMAGQLETVTGLLGNALAPGLGIAHSDAHRKHQPRKAG